MLFASIREVGESVVLYLLKMNRIARLCTISSRYLSFLRKGSHTTEAYCSLGSIIILKASNLTCVGDALSLCRKKPNLRVADAQMFSMCFDHDRVLVNVIPRYLYWLFSTTGAPFIE